MILFLSYYQRRHSHRYHGWHSLPCTLTASEFILDIVHGVPGSLADGSLVLTVSSDPRFRNSGQELAVLGRMATYVLVLGLGVDELLAEILPVAVVRSLVDDDLLVVIGELVDDVFVLLVELQIVVGGDAFLRDRGSVIGRQ